MKRKPTDWKCTISLEIFYDELGRSLTQPQSIQFGDALSNPDDVEDRVRRAQQAILTPSVSPEEFLYMSTSGARELSFSKNYILIQVEGSNVADLSFVDLPGKQTTSLPFPAWFLNMDMSRTCCDCQARKPIGHKSDRRPCGELHTKAKHVDTPDSRLRK